MFITAFCATLGVGLGILAMIAIIVVIGAIIN